MNEALKDYSELKRSRERRARFPDDVLRECLAYGHREYDKSSMLTIFGREQLEVKFCERCGLLYFDDQD